VKAGSEARRAIYAAHSEAQGARNGIGLVKLMGRDSGFIAAYTTLANSQVNFCLLLEQNAVHAGLAGKTDLVVGNWHHQGTHGPIFLAAPQRKKMDLEGWIWNSVLAITGQPRHLV
jgi:6-phosphofructokinase